MSGSLIRIVKLPEQAHAMPKFKINYERLPVKAHYFFFMGAMGPILPFLPVLGKQLGVAEIVMGLINAILPFLYAGFKPVFGFLMDYFQSKKKIIFMAILAATSAMYLAMAFIPSSATNVGQFSCEGIPDCQSLVVRPISCWYSCGNHTQPVTVDASKPCLVEPMACSAIKSDNCTVACPVESVNLYIEPSFWIFVILTCLGTIGFNVSNNLSDAICFNVLGKGNEEEYGNQRVWGTIGFGLTALLGSYFVNHYQNQADGLSNYLYALILAAAFMVLDLLCCSKIKIPPLPKSENILKDTVKMLKERPIAIFICFAICVGILDSIIIFYLLWYLEDLAKITNQEANIKLLEGLTIALETLCGEAIFFRYSGRILSKMGHINCLTMCFAMYALRLGLIAAIPSPWWVLPIESVMQGPTYGLCYATIVVYASEIAPPGTSATVQGIVAGMDDGLGFTIGNIVGGIVYRYFGGRSLFVIFSMFAAVCCVAHFILHAFLSKDNQPDASIKMNATGSLQDSERLQNVDITKVTTYVPEKSLTSPD